MTIPAARALRVAGEVLSFDPARVRRTDGYVDLLGAGGPRPNGLAQRLMQTRLVAAVYDRWWRPALGRAVKGPGGPSMAGERDLMARLLHPGRGAVVLDVACGPGTFTRRLAAQVGEPGVVIGLDLSPTMLAQAVGSTVDPNVVYVRADITAVPVRPCSVEAVACFAALHLFAEPQAAVEAMCAALAPGGRLAILTTSRPDAVLIGPMADAGAHAFGTRMFRRDELRRLLPARGFEILYHRAFGVMQLLAARRRPSVRGQ